MTSTLYIKETATCKEKLPLREEVLPFFMEGILSKPKIVKEKPKVCSECGYKGPESNCPDCGAEMLVPESLESQPTIASNDNLTIREALEEEQGVKL